MDPRGTTAKRQKCGRFLTHQRANVDQVPLPFVNDMEDTLDEEKGADRVERCVCIEPLARSPYWSDLRSIHNYTNTLKKSKKVYISK